MSMNFNLISASPHRADPQTPPSLIVGFHGPADLNESATLAMESGRREAEQKLAAAVAEWDVTSVEKANRDKLAAALDRLTAELAAADKAGLAAAAREREQMFSDAASAAFAEAVRTKQEVSRRLSEVKTLHTQAVRSYGDARGEAKRAAAQRLADEAQERHDVAGATVSEALAAAFDDLFTAGAAANLLRDRGK